MREHAPGLGKILPKQITINKEKTQNAMLNEIYENMFSFKILREVKNADIELIS